MDRADFLRFAGLGSLSPFFANRPSLSGYGSIHQLKEFFIAGFMYYDGLDFVDHISVGDKLRLQMEPDNPYDGEAIEVYWRNRVKLGHVPQIHNTVITELLKQDVFVEAVVTVVNPHCEPWEMVKVLVTLRI